LVACGPQQKCFLQRLCHVLEQHNIG
jgi:hypothetical protein